VILREQGLRIAQALLRLDQRQPLVQHVLLADCARIELRLFTREQPHVVVEHMRECAFLRAQKEVHADPKLRLELVMKIAGMDEATAKTVPEAWFETIAITKEATASAYDTLIRTGMMTKTFPVEDVIATLPF